MASALPVDQLAQPSPALLDALYPDERLRWHGKPGPGFRLSPWDGFLIPFSLVWTGFVLYATTEMAVKGAPWSSLIFLLPFLAAGFYLLAGRFLLDRYFLRRTEYALTQRRVVIVTGGYWPNVKSIPLHTLTDVTLAPKRRGRGTITLGRNPIGGSFIAPWVNPASYLAPTLHNISEGRAVYDLILAEPGSSPAAEGKPG